MQSPIPYGDDVANLMWGAAAAVGAFAAESLRRKKKYLNAQKPRPLEGNTTNLLSQLVQNLRAMPGNFERQFML